MVKKLKKLKIPFLLFTILVISCSTLLISSAAVVKLPKDLVVDVPAGKKVEIVTSVDVPAYSSGKAYINLTSEKLDVPVCGYLYYYGDTHANIKLTDDMFYEPDELTTYAGDCSNTFANCKIGVAYNTGHASLGDYYNVSSIPSYTSTDGTAGVLYLLALVDDDGSSGSEFGVLEVITALFASIGQWLSDSLGYLIPMFWINGELTFLGMLCIVPLAFSVVFLIIGIIQNFLRFGG